MEALTPLSSAKPDLRRHFRALRAAFMARAGSEAVVRLTTHLQRLLTDLAVDTVALYRPLFDEARFDFPDLTAFYYPRVEGEQLAFYRPSAPDAFVKGVWGLLEPDPARSLALDLNSPFAVVCPGVAFDWKGGRLGLGKGYYDRFLAVHPRAVRIGAGFQVQMTKDPLPADSWDQALDWIVTEEMILHTSNRSS